MAPGPMLRGPSEGPKPVLEALDTLSSATPASVYVLCHTQGLGHWDPSTSARPLQLLSHLQPGSPALS